MMKNVFFTPWVGKLYFEKRYNNKKILILGESHHCGYCADCKNPKDCNLTIVVIGDYLNYKNGNAQFEKWMGAFTKFTNIFFGKNCDVETLNNFWNSIIFYNYVQKPINEPRIEPTKQMFNDSENAFFEILNEYDPDIIIVWGKRLWDNLPHNGYWGEKCILDDQGGKFYYYTSKSKDIPAYRIDHPSTPSFKKKCSKYLKEIMQLI